jgi:hypothetical protein
VEGIDDSGTAVEALSSLGIGVLAETQGSNAVSLEGYANGGFGVVGISDSTAPIYGYYLGGADTGEDFIGFNSLTGNNTWLDYWSGTTEYKILGSGTVSTTVKDTKGDKVVLHCPETPEIYFEDYGEGQLVNGKVHIILDPTIAKNVAINEKHPLRVFIQLRGDCKGTYVTNENATGFDVIELNGGKSNAPFNWHIIANRADEVMTSGKISKNADVRFEKAPALKSPPKVANVNNLGKPFATAKKKGKN